MRVRGYTSTCEERTYPVGPWANLWFREASEKGREDPRPHPQPLHRARFRSRDKDRLFRRQSSLARHSSVSQSEFPPALPWCRNSNYSVPQTPTNNISPSGRLAGSEVFKWVESHRQNRLDVWCRANVVWHTFDIGGPGPT